MGAAVLDITAQPVDRTGKWAEKQRIDKIMFNVGGDAANQSMRLADIGIGVGIVSAVGCDRNAQLIKTELLNRKVDIKYLKEKREHPTGTSLVLVDKNAERSTFSVKGGAYACLNKEDIKNILLPGMKALSIASFFIDPQLEADGGMEECLRTAQSMGILTFADMSHDKNNLGLNGIRGCLPYLNYFLPSIYDAQKMNGVESAEENAEIYRALGCKNIIIKCGAKGCYVLAEGFEGWIPARKVKPVDTTGAGDCMVAFFISGILKGYAVDQACRFACDAATYSTLFSGASSHRFTVFDVEGWKRT